MLKMGKKQLTMVKWKKKIHFNWIDNLLVMSECARCARESDGSATPRQDSLTLSNKELHSPSLSLKYKAVHWQLHIKDWIIFCVRFANET